MNSRFSAIVFLVFVMVVWGSGFAVTKAALVEVPPVTFALLRFDFASILLVLLAMKRGGLAKLPRPAPVGTIWLMGLTGVYLYYLGFNISLVYTSASQGALIQSFIPIVTALLATVFLKERLPAKRLGGIGLSVAGIVLIMTLAEAGADAPFPLLGNLIMFGAVMAWAAYTILVKRVAHIDQFVAVRRALRSDSGERVAIISERIGKNLPPGDEIISEEKCGRRRGRRKRRESCR